MKIVKNQMDLVEYLAVHQGVVSLVFRNLLVVNARMAFLKHQVAGAVQWEQQNRMENAYVSKFCS